MILTAQLRLLLRLMLRSVNHLVTVSSLSCLYFFVFYICLLNFMQINFGIKTIFYCSIADGLDKILFQRPAEVLFVKSSQNPQLVQYS